MAMDNLDNISKQLADLLVHFRKSAKLTQVELAQRTGLSQSFLSRIESNASSAPFDTYAYLLRECGVDIMQIMQRYAAAQEEGRQVEHWEKVSAALAQVLDELGRAVAEEKHILIAMDRYGAFSGITDPSKARRKIIETWWALREDSGRR